MKLFNKKDKLYITKYIFMSALHLILMIFLPYLISILVDTVIPSKSLIMLRNWVLVSTGVYMLYHFILLKYIKYSPLKYLFKKTGESAEIVLKKYLDKDVYKTKDMSEGYIMNVLLSDMNVYLDIEIYKLKSYVINGLGILLVSSILLVKSKLAFLILLTSIPIYLIIGKQFKPKLALHQKNQKNEYDQTISQLQNILSHKKSLVLLNKKEFFIDKFTYYYNNWVEYGIRFNYLRYISEELPQIISNLVRVIIIGIMCFGIIEGNVTIGNLIFVSSVIPFVFSFLNDLVETYLRGEVNKVSRDRILEIYQTEKKEEFQKIKDGISIENVNIKFENELLYKVKDFSINKNGVYMLQGKNGTGKSTLFNIIKRIVKPSIENEENILVSEEFEDASYLSSPHIFINDTVEENILLGKKRCDDFNEIMKVLGIDNEFLIRPVELKGNNLSYGEQQKIALARVLIENKDVIYLDEPFVNLDKSTKEKLLNYLETQKSAKKIFIISHESEVEKISNKIFTIENNVLC